MNTTLITGASSGIGRAALYLLLVIAMLLIAFAQATVAQQSANAPQGTQKICQQILVMGAVRTAAQLDARRGLRLLEALAMAGGPTKRVGKTIRVVHSCECSTCDKPGTKAGRIDEYNLADVVRGRENENPYLAPGDIVVVSGADLVAVIGSVKKTEIVFVDGMTMMRAIELAGGVGKNGELVLVRIYRTSIEGPRRDPIIVNLKAIKERRIEDVLLQPWDLIEVSDELGHFRAPKFSNPIWDPPLVPRKDSSCS